MAKTSHAASVVYKAPRTTQKTIPIEEVYADGMMKHGRVYSCAYAIDDTNYTATSEENQADILLKYEEIIKAVASDVEMKVVVINRLEDEDRLHHAIDLKMQGDGKDPLRTELNGINWERAMKGDNNIHRDRILVLSGVHDSKEHAAIWFNRMQEHLFRDINALGTRAKKMNADDRLETLSRFLRPSAVWDRHDIDEMDLSPKEKKKLKKAQFNDNKRMWADRIAPDGIEFHASGSYFRIDDRYGRALMIRDFPTNMDDTLVSDIMNMPREMIVTADYVAMAKDQALKIINRHKDKVEGDIRKRTVNSGKEGNWNAAIPRHLEEERETCDYMVRLEAAA